MRYERARNLLIATASTLAACSPVPETRPLTAGDHYAAIHVRLFNAALVETECRTRADAARTDAAVECAEQSALVEELRGRLDSFQVANPAVVSEFNSRCTPFILEGAGYRAFLGFECVGEAGDSPRLSE